MRRFDPPLSATDFALARKRLLQMHYEARVGHIGGNLSAIDGLLIVLHEYVQPEDMFILSKGHSAGALYTALWTLGHLSDDALTFHQDGTLLAGHPPASGIPQIAFATGSLGHGLSLAAGSALGFRFRSSEARVFCLMSDGEWQEGSTWEALIFAAHHRLSNLKVLVDHNNLQGFGSTDAVASMSPLWEKLAGFDVVVDVIDGHDAAAIRAALDRPSDRPHLIFLRTKKGSGVSFMEERMEWHYLPLCEEQYQLAIQEIDRQ
jgi:transketolase